MIILGLNAYHGDSSACLVRDGQLVAAVEEERFRRIKHWAGFPTQSVDYCLREAGLKLSDVDHVALNQNNWSNIWQKVGYLLRKRPDPGLVMQRLRNRMKRTGVAELLKQAFPGEKFRAQVQGIDHHLCHLFSAYYVSPFREAAVVSVDGFGD